ncbi:MAG: DUF2889 domain-containing protein [Deltaproteobacteria bacterium]|jgi:hypothetical protein|nr:DUF2889 domain-containing protein [Deltaproteobacteria bacterium]
MPKMPCYSRNRATSVEQIDATTLTSTCRLQDSFTDAHVTIHVRLPELEIIAADGAFSRISHETCRGAEEALEKVVGVRIGAGMKKIIRGLVGEVTDCGELAVLVEECCHAVILAFTKEMLGQVPEELKKEKDFFANMVKENIRLYNSCAAFAPGSPIVEGIDPP